MKQVDVRRQVERWSLAEGAALALRSSAKGARINVASRALHEMAAR